MVTIIQKEEGRQYLSYIQEQLQQRIREIGVSIEDGEKDVGQMHEYYWENYTEMDQYGYENYDNQQALFSQISANEDARKLLRRYSKMLQNPFFGRVDFVFEGEEEKEIFYIGIGNFSLDNGLEPLIFDWRAPVSGLFYDYDKGEASYMAPMGEIRGEILSKWQYKIKNGRMVYEFESDIKIDDEILKAELGSKGEDKLKNIIRTIQKEQNAIIRNTSDRILVIQGAAGSGKTSIALHRIAYLLYHDRKNLNSSNILILSPNGIFADYISHILPELGEENIREMTLDVYAYRQLRDLAYDCEDRYDYVEKELAGIISKKRQEENRYKQSKGFINRMEGFIIRLEDELVNFTDISYGSHEITADQILELFYFKFPEQPLLTRMEFVADYFIDEIETIKGRDLSEENRQEIREGFFSLYQCRDIYEIYRRFCEIEGVHMPPRAAVNERIIPYEDVYPLLYLKERLVKHRVDLSIRHLVVDEMQDYTWLQFTLLSRMFQCRMTILGDRAQTIEDTRRDVTKFLPSVFGKKTRILYMNKCYRNTSEIAEYANVLAGITRMELVERHGDPVKELQFSQLEGAAAGIADLVAERSDSFETAAVIVLTKDEASEVSVLLKEALEEKGYDVGTRFSLLHSGSKKFCRGLTVTTFYLAKGLEFDHVYGLFPAGEDAPLVKQAKYITATRAMHKLWMAEYRRK